MIAQTRLMATPEYLKNQKAEEKQEATMASKVVYNVVVGVRMMNEFHP